MLVSDDEAPKAVERDGMYVILPEPGAAGARESDRPFQGARYTSDDAEPLNARELDAMVAEPREAPAAPRRARPRG